jgi:hypothetical protein
LMSSKKRKAMADLTVQPKPPSKLSDNCIAESRAFAPVRHGIRIPVESSGGDGRGANGCGLEGAGRKRLMYKKALGESLVG